MSTPELDLSFERTIPRRLVHRDAVHEVLLTDVVELEEDHYAVGCQLSRSHPLFGDRRGDHHDTLMLMEAGRQATVVIAHEFCGVSREWAFIANRMKAEVGDPAPLLDGDAMAEATIEMRTSDKRHREDGLLTAMRFDVAVSISERHVADMGGGLMFMPATDYRSLRGHVRAGKRLGGPSPPRPEPLPAAAVGRFNPRNVVIGPAGERSANGERRFEMVVDRGHPSLFDHPLDHVPAIFLLEALRQSAVATAAEEAGLAPEQALPVSCAARFDDFAELELPVECVATVGDDDGGDRTGIEISVLQEERPIAAASIELIGARR